MKRAGAMVTLIVIAAITGCSASKSSDSAAGNSSNNASAPKQSATAATALLDPCKLLTPQEAAAETGAKVSIDRLKNAVYTTCEFLTPSEDALTVTSEPADLYEGFAVTPGMVPVQGIGEKALWLNFHGTNHLDVLKDGDLEEIIFPGKSASLTPAMMKVGKEIASRM